MKIDESPAKQVAVRKHIEQVVEKKLRLLDKKYESKRTEYIENHMEKKKKEIAVEIKPIIEELRKTKEKLFKTAEKLQYKLGNVHSGDWYDEVDIEIPEIKEENIKECLKEEYESMKAKIKEQISEQIDEKKLDITEKILFADEKELLQLVGELKEMKIEL